MSQTSKPPHRSSLNDSFVDIVVEDVVRQFDENEREESERETTINQTNAESTRGMIIEKSKRVFIFLLLGVSAVPRRQER